MDQATDQTEVLRARLAALVHEARHGTGDGCPACQGGLIHDILADGWLPDVVRGLLDKAAIYRRSQWINHEHGLAVASAMESAAHDFAHPGCEDSTVAHLAEWLATMATAPSCTCVMVTDQTPWAPAEWEQADDCPVHPIVIHPIDSPALNDWFSVTENRDRDLGLARSELTAARAELEKRDRDLGQVILAHAERDDAREDLKSIKTDRDAARTELTEAQTQLRWVRQRVADLHAALEATDD